MGLGLLFFIFLLYRHYKEKQQSKTFAKPGEMTKTLVVEEAKEDKDKTNFVSVTDL